MRKASTAVARKHSPHPEKKGTKYLFIGYNPPGHDFVINELNARGCEITTISDLSQALDRIPELRPEMIVYRIYFQRSSIKAALDQLATAAARVNSTLVVMSPRVTEADIKNSIQMGVSDFVLIPCEPKLLVRRLDYQLSRRKLFETEELVGRSKELSSSLKLISDVTRVVASIPDAHRRLYESLRLIADFIKSPRVNLFHGRPNHDAATVIASSDSNDVRNYRTKLEKYPEVREVLLKGMIVHVSDVSTNRLTQSLHQQLRSIKVDSIIVLPIKYRGKLLGALHMRLQKSTAQLAQKQLNTFYTVALALGSTMAEVIDSEK